MVKPKKKRNQRKLIKPKHRPETIWKSMWAGKKSKEKYKFDWNTDKSKQRQKLKPDYTKKLLLQKFQH
ncbi:hypothetical protein HYE02_03715 [Mycoplasmopsis bovis]|nr:hypothetical protein [Mycoplasmopsis bovis]QQH28185.1 hypothetical protein HYE02_03715 [Mycoplasmopsis bovis]